jgi:hypothetical protein
VRFTFTVYIAVDVNLADDNPQRPPVRKPNLVPWGIAGALIVIGGIVAAIVTGGGGAGSDTGSAGSRLQGSGQSTEVANAPPPKQGDKVLAASETTVRDTKYRIVVSTLGSKGPVGGSVPLFLNEYVNGKLVDRFLVPNAKFFRDSAIAGLDVEPDPGRNPDKNAGLAFSWFHHIGDQHEDTKYYRVSQKGIRLY